MPILVSILAAVGVLVYYRLWGNRFESDRRRVYEQLRRDARFRQPPAVDPFVAETGATTDHVQGQVGEFTVDIFENSSDITSEDEVIYTKTIVMVSHPSWQLPFFRLEPRDLVAALNERVEGKRPVQFPMDEEFERGCFVTGRDHGAIRQTLIPSVTCHLRKSGELCLESRGHALLFYETEALLSLRRIDAVLARALAVAEAIALPQRTHPIASTE